DVKSVAFDTGFNFSNGTHTVATVGENGKVTFDLSSDAANKLNQVDNKMSSFKIKANNTTEETIADGDTVVFKDGKNINITRSDKELTVKTVDAPV
ncbi:hypothetical protein, partial [Glaesserella parasuis]|uniref:hypothetical protein n=1 Tax=Glaesserella parasuis TaxID=738 RepID=UPI003B66C5AF